MFEYTLEIEDRVAYQLWFLDASGKAARLQRRMWLTGLGACLLIFTVPVAFIVERTAGPMNPVLGLVVTWVLCTPIWLAVVTIRPNLTRAWLTRRATTAVRRSRRNKPEEMIRLWLDETGVNCTSHGLSTHRAWSPFRVSARLPATSSSRSTRRSPTSCPNDSVPEQSWPSQPGSARSWRPP
ncbi:MAG TPA: hypothetical protein VGK53_04625 [Propionicimonas sp.]